MSESGGVNRLAQLVQQLEDSGEHGERLHTARCALGFKRSWVDLAAALCTVRKLSLHRKWGYSDLFAYCATELGLRNATVDKLLVSYATLSKHAPDRLERGSSAALPSYLALDYLARATGEPRGNGKPPRDCPEEPPDQEVMEALHKAVFEDGRSARQLRQQFDPLVRPRSTIEQQQIVIRRVSATAHRLIEQLNEVEELEMAPLTAISDTIEALRAQAKALSEHLRTVAAAA